MRQSFTGFAGKFPSSLGIDCNNFHLSQLIPKGCCYKSYVNTNPCPSAISCFGTNLSPRLLTFHFRVFFSRRKSLFLKIYHDVILHVICRLSPPLQSKILATSKLEFNKVLCLVIFLFTQSKNNAVLQPRAEHFQGLVGFKAKDLSVDAKDFKVCPQELHLCLLHMHVIM